MFTQTFVDGAGRTRRKWTVFVSASAQAVLVGGAMLVPLIFTDQLPAVKLVSILEPPSPPPPPPPKPDLRPITQHSVPFHDLSHLTIPTSVPERVVFIQDPIAPPTGSDFGIEGGTGPAGGANQGVLTGILSAANRAAPPPPPPVKTTSKPPEIIRVTAGGLVKPPRPISQPSPVYPPLARQARISGVVHLEAVIDRYGRIQNLHVLDGHPMLVNAAFEAVKRWVYQPTELNGEPVEVITQISVNFSLSQ